MQHPDDRLNAALWWLARGWDLLPCQPDSKRLVMGFGIHQKHITTNDDCYLWFFERNANMAAVARNKTSWVLDFDDFELWSTWSGKHPGTRNTRTERTRRGVHVFFYANMPQGIEWRNGVELKQSTLIAPSTVEGFEYHVIGGSEVLEFSDDELSMFSDISREGHRTPYVLHIQQTRPRQIAMHGTVIDQIKSAVTIVEMVQRETPKCFSSLSGHGAFLSGLCPFHDDHKASFWINTESNLWGCHGCKRGGDVINFYALVHHLTNRDAMQALRAEVVQ